MTVLGGDFSQVFIVVQNGIKEQIMFACIVKSFLWAITKVLYGHKAFDHWKIIILQNILCALKMVLNLLSMVIWSKFPTNLQ